MYTLVWYIDSVQLQRFQQMQNYDVRALNEQSKGSTFYLVDHEVLHTDIINPLWSVFFE